MKTKKKILIFIDWFLPGFKAGGPIQSVSNLIVQTSSIFDFTIITSDRDLGDTKPYSEKLNHFIEKEEYKIIYLSPENRTKAYFETLLAKLSFELVYFNSFFSKEFTIVPLGILNKKYKKVTRIIAPRGMLGEGALNIKKAKKKVFITATKLTGLYKNVKWHATTEDEKFDILNIFSKSKTAIVAENIGKKQGEFIDILKEKGNLKLVFISRIASKKNLHFAIKQLSEIKTGGTITFDIFGPIEDDNYWNLCLEEAGKLPENIKLSYLGELKPSEISAKFGQYHFFFFPTLHENFGHVIYEALAVGCPVILSENTPWRNLEKENVGNDISLENKTEFQTTIKNYLEMGNEKYQIMAKASYNYILNNNSSQSVVNQYLNLFKND